MYALVQNWQLTEIFFAKDRMVPEEKRFNSYRTRECYFIYKKKTRKRKSHESLFESLSKNRYMMRVQGSHGLLSSVFTFPFFSPVAVMMDSFAADHI